MIFTFLALFFPLSTAPSFAGGGTQGCRSAMAEIRASTFHVDDLDEYAAETTNPKRRYQLILAMRAENKRIAKTYAYADTCRCQYWKRLRPATVQRLSQKGCRE